MLQHTNVKFANQVVYWNGTDTYELWEKNLKDSEKYQYLSNQNWLYEHAIEYRFNSAGFRCVHEFNNDPCNIALGCSHTQGIGVSLGQTWSAHIPNCLNLGVGGASLDTCFRVLEFAIDNLNIDTVYVLEPQPQRVELYIDEWKVISHHKPNEFYKQWINADENWQMQLKKNRLSMQHLCTTNDIEFKMLALTDIKAPSDRGRDFAHSGPKWHKSVAHHFLNQ